MPKNNKSPLVLIMLLLLCLRAFADTANLKVILCHADPYIPKGYFEQLEANFETAFPSADVRAVTSKELGKTIERVEAGDVVLLYYADHGTLEDEGSLRLGDDSYIHNLLRLLNKEQPGQILLLVDACLKPSSGRPTVKTVDKETNRIEIESNSRLNTERLTFSKDGQIARVVAQLPSTHDTYLYEAFAPRGRDTQDKEKLEPDLSGKAYRGDPPLTLELPDKLGPPMLLLLGNQPGLPSFYDSDGPIMGSALSAVLKEYATFGLYDEPGTRDDLSAICQKTQLRASTLAACNLGEYQAPFLVRVGYDPPLASAFVRCSKAEFARLAVQFCPKDALEGSPDKEGDLAPISRLELGQFLHHHNISFVDADIRFDERMLYFGLPEQVKKSVTVNVLSQWFTLPWKDQALGCPTDFDELRELYLEPSFRSVLDQLERAIERRPNAGFETLLEELDPISAGTLTDEVKIRLRCLVEAAHQKRDKLARPVSIDEVWRAFDESIRFQAGDVTDPYQTGRPGTSFIPKRVYTLQLPAGQDPQVGQQPQQALSLRFVEVPSSVSGALPAAMVRSAEWKFGTIESRVVADGEIVILDKLDNRAGELKPATGTVLLMATSELSVAQYLALIEEEPDHEYLWWSNGRYRPGPTPFEDERKPDDPVAFVSFAEAQAYCDLVTPLLNEELGPGACVCRIPTDVEWLAAAGGRLWPWGQQPPDDRYLRRGPVPAATRFPGISPLGCSQMSGNLWEWVEHTGSSQPGESPTLSWARGGSYESGNPLSVSTRSSRGLRPSGHYSDVGFRIAIAIDRKALDKWKSRGEALTLPSTLAE